MSTKRATRLATTLAVTGISLALLGALVAPMRFTGLDLAGTALTWSAVALILTTTTTRPARRQETRA